MAGRVPGGPSPARPWDRYPAVAHVPTRLGRGAGVNDAVVNPRPRRLFAGEVVRVRHTNGLRVELFAVPAAH